jgi:hypothetical protein
MDGMLSLDVTRSMPPNENTAADFGRSMRILMRYCVNCWRDCRGRLTLLQSMVEQKSVIATGLFQI